MNRYLAKIDFIKLSLGNENDKLILAQLRNGFIPDKYKEEYENYINNYADENNRLLTPLELIQYDIYFDINPSHVAGTQIAGSGYLNPVKTKGGIEDVETMFLKAFTSDIESEAEIIDVPTELKTTINTQPPIPMNEIQLSENEAEKLYVAVMHNTSEKEAKDEPLTFSMDEVIENYNPGISTNEIKAWVWYKRQFGNPMRGFEKYYISNSKSGKKDILLYAKETMTVKDNAFRDVREVTAGTLLGKLTKFSNEYRGINYIVFKTDNQELLWADEGKTKSIDQTFYTEPLEIENLVKAKVLVYAGGDFLPIPVFTFGNMYEREKTLEADKEHIENTYGIEMYQFYKKMIQDAKPSPLRFNNPLKSLRPTVSCKSKFANDITLISITELNEETGLKLERPRKMGQYNQEIEPFTLFEAFVYWLDTVREQELKNTNKQMIFNYFIHNRKWPKDIDGSDLYSEVEKAEIKANARIAAEDLFCQFLASGLLPNDVAKLNYLWNAEYNAYSTVRADKVPVAFECSRTFKNKEFSIRPVQRNGLAFLGLTNSGCLAYDVGYGKTMTAIVNVAQNISTGKSRRPLIAVPRATYANWKKELFGYYTDGNTIDFKPFKNAQFVTGILSNTRYKLNDWANLNVDKLKALGDINKLIPEDTITLVTYQGLAQIGFSKEIYDSIFNNLVDCLENGANDQTARQTEQTYSKYREMMGEGRKETVCDIDVIGLDHLTIDEAHNFKNVFPSVGKDDDGKNMFGITSGQSTRAQKLYFLANYIQRKYNGNVTLLTATPFTNSPLEIYSMLSHVGFESLRKYNLQNIRRFFETFVSETIEYILNLKGELQTKPVIKSFNNKIVLQKLLYNHFDYRNDPKEAGIVRPCKVNLPMMKSIIDNEVVQLGSESITTYLDMNEWQIQNQKQVVSEANSSSRTNPGAMFRAMARSLDNAISPYFASKEIPDSYLDLVEQSPKIMYVCKCIDEVKKYHEERNEDVSGQVIYCNRGKHLFGYIKQYLEQEVGYKKKVKFGEITLDEVEIIEGGGDKKDEDRKENIKEAFLKGVVKIIIGTSTIKEGVNLQNKGTVLYNLQPDWNPTDMQQLEGRIWRQGNEYGFVRIVMPLVQNSMDAFVFQKLEEKSSRISDLWARANNTNMMESEALDPEEIKYALISNSDELVKMTVSKEIKLATNEVKTATENLSTYGELTSLIYSYNQDRSYFIEDLSSNLPELKNYLDLIVNIKEQRGKEIDKKLEIEWVRTIENLNQLIAAIVKFQTDSPQNDQSIFEILRMMTQRNYEVSVISTPYSLFRVSDYRRSNFRENFGKVKKVEKEILFAYGLTIFDDLTELKATLDNAVADAQLKLDAVNSEAYYLKILGEVNAELEKRSSVRGNLDDQVRKFASLNHLLSYKSDNIDKDICNLPTVPCCPTNGREEIVLEREIEEEV